jgi:hypothetical protein
VRVGVAVRVGVTSSGAATTTLFTLLTFCLANTYNMAVWHRQKRLAFKHIIIREAAQ